MSLLGNIWVKLGLKSDDFNTGMTKAEKRAERFGSFLGKMSARMVLGWAAVATAVTKFTKASVANYQQQQQANIKLQNALKNTGAAIGYNYDELRSYADQLQKVNGFADDATMSAMATLTTFRSVQGKVFKDTIAAAQDMAQFLGTDLNTTVQQLGKALEAPEVGITMLRRSGVVFTKEMTDGIKQMVNEGKLYEAQLLILEEVNKRFGGEAARQADTAAGQWKRVGMAFGDLTEKIGQTSEVSKDLARGLAETLENADKILSSERLTKWQKFMGILGIGQEKINKLLEEEDAERAKQAETIKRHVETVMDGVDSEEKARAKLAKQKEMYDDAEANGYTERKAMAEAAMAELNKYIALKEEEAEKERERQKEEAERLKKYREEHTGLLNELKDEIEKKEKLLRMAKDTSEVAKLNAEIERLLERKRILENMGKGQGNDYSGITGKIPGSVVPKAKSLQQQNAQDIRNTWNAILDENQKALKKLELQKDQAEEIAQGFGEAFRSGIIDTLDELAEQLGSGDWDTTALIKALLTPMADMAISAGTIILGTGEAVEALKKALENMNGYAAVIAGSALIAAGFAAKTGLAALAKSAGNSGGSTQNPYTYTGGNGISPALISQGYGQMEITVNGVLKGQDIYLSGENYKKSLGR